MDGTTAVPLPIRPEALSDLGGCSDAGTVGGEEVHGVPVEVAGGAVVVLGGPGVGVPGEDLRVAKRHAGIQRVGERGVPQRVRADVPWDAGCLPLPAAGLEHA